MSTDRFDRVMARADRVMAQVDEKQGASRAAALRERQRLMGGYGRALTRGTLVAGAIVLGALLFGLVMPIGMIGFVAAVGVAIAAFGLIFFGGAVSTATTPTVPTDLPNAQMVDRFDSLLFKVRRALPTPAQSELDRLSASLPPLRETLSRVEDLNPEAQDARRLLSVHLPGLIDRYLNVPQAYRHDTDAEGKTVDQRLVDALAAGREALGDVSTRLARADLAAFETQGRFIESRYRDAEVD